MKLSRGVLIIAVSAVVLVVGVVLGLLPVKASLTQVRPQLRLLTVSCGNGYLQVTPPVQAGDLVALPDERGVFLPKQSFTAHCSEAVGWRRLAAWGLTGLGVLGLAVAFASASGSSGASAPAAPKRSRRAGPPAKPGRRADSDVLDDPDDPDDPDAPSRLAGSRRLPRHGRGFEPAEYDPASPDDSDDTDDTDELGGGDDPAGSPTRPAGTDPAAGRRRSIGLPSSSTPPTTSGGAHRSRRS